jgi:hypothetical protein
MKNIKKVVIALSLLGAVGLTYLIATFKSFQDIFDLEDDDENF